MDTLPELADALFTRTQQRVLGLLYGNTAQSYYLNEIVRLAAIGKGTVTRELQRLAAAGILVARRQGNQVHYQAVLCSDSSQLLLYRTSCGTVCILGVTPKNVNTYI